MNFSPLLIADNMLDNISHTRNPKEWTPCVPDPVLASSWEVDEAVNASLWSHQK